MANPTLYRKQPVSSATIRTTTPATADEKVKIDNTLTKFFDLFKLAHM
jgi:hypothetical protein